MYNIYSGRRRFKSRVGKVLFHRRSFLLRPFPPARSSRLRVAGKFPRFGANLPDSALEPVRFWTVLSHYTWRVVGCAERKVANMCPAERTSQYAEHQFYVALRDRIERLVRWYCRSHDDDVADLTQECLLRVYSKLDSLRDLDKMEPWLRTVVRNAVFTWYRERKREQEICSLGLEADMESEAYSIPENDLLLYFVLQEAMQTLSEIDRQMFEWRYGAGLSYREIAQRTGLNQEAVRKRVTRALSRLKAHPIVQSTITEGG